MNLDQAKQWILAQMELKTILAKPEQFTSNFYAHLVSLVNTPPPPPKPERKEATPWKPRADGKTFPPADDNTRMWFGKHKGERLADVPDQYLTFIKGWEAISPDLLRYIEEERKL